MAKEVWPDTFVEEGSLAQNISILRKVLGENANGQPYIQTIPKRGYRFVVPVAVAPTSGPELENWRVWHKNHGRPRTGRDSGGMRAYGGLSRSTGGTRNRGKTALCLGGKGTGFPRPDCVTSRSLEATKSQEVILVRIMLTFMLVTCSSLLAQSVPDKLTGGMINCRLWNTAPSDFKLGFLAGFGDAFHFVAYDLKTLKGRDYLPSQSTNGEIIKGADVICAAPENASLTMSMAFALFTEKVVGVSEADVAAMTEEFRRMAAQMAQSGKP